LEENYTPPDINCRLRSAHSSREVWKSERRSHAQRVSISLGERPGFQGLMFHRKEHAGRVRWEIAREPPKTREKKRGVGKRKKKNRGGIIGSSLRGLKKGTDQESYNRGRGKTAREGRKRQTEVIVPRVRGKWNLKRGENMLRDEIKGVCERI